MPRKSQSPALLVRPMRRSDISACAKLVADTALWQRYRYDGVRCARDLTRALARGDELNVAAAGSEVLGFAWVMPQGAFGRVPYLKLLAVSESARNQGVGPKLLEAAEQRGELMLMVADFNRGARRFYTRLGYRRVGALPGFVLPDVTELILFKRLTPKPRAGRRRAASPASGARGR